MFKRRIIPVFYLQSGLLVRSEVFNIHQYIGHPVGHADRMTNWDVDELVILDISKDTATYEILREDQMFKGSRDLVDFIQKVANSASVPLTFGGGIRTFDDVRQRILHGADKVAVNTLLAEAPDVVSHAVRVFGSQAIVASIDYKVVDGEPMVYTGHGKTSTGIDAMEWARRAQDVGAGEILLNSIDRDGTARGFDVESIGAVVSSVDIPVICCGGAGHQSHFRKVLEQTDVAAVGAGNFFHFTENSYPRLKEYLRQSSNQIR